MDPARVAELLQPFLISLVSPEQLNQISSYIDLLLRWNARVNLSAIREPEEIVTRHFGESLFAASHLLPSPQADAHLVDVGSGAGFPGLATKIWAPALRVTLIESNHKKATFLREVARALELTNVEVFAGRAEDFPAKAEFVTLRAVERFEIILPTAVRLVASGGSLGLLIGEAQAQSVPQLAGELQWRDALPIPLSSRRVVLIGRCGNQTG